MKNLSVTVKLLLSYALMLLIFVSSSGYVIYNRGTLEKLSFWSEHTYKVIASVNDMMAAMVDQETGFRGFLITGNQGNLDPYKSGLKNFDTALNEVKALTSDNAAQQKRLQTVADLATSWRTNVAERGIALMANEATREQARDLERSGAGKTSMDGLRKLVAELLNAESSLLVTRNQERNDAFSAITVAIWASIAIAVAAALVISWQMARLISAPLKEIVAKMTSVADGNLTIEIPYRDRGDEIGMAAKGLEDFRVKLIDADMRRKHQQEAEAAAVAQQMERARMAEAFAARMTQISEGFSSSSGEVASASRNLAATAEETARQAQAVSGAAEEASANVQTVAASTEEMTASVREIASQVAKSAAVANTAAAEAARTESDVRACRKPRPRSARSLNSSTISPARPISSHSMPRSRRRVQAKRARASRSSHRKSSSSPIRQPRRLAKSRPRSTKSSRRPTAPSARSSGSSIPFRTSSRSRR